MKKGLGLFAVVLFASALVSPSGAFAKDEETRAFEFHVGDEFLQGAAGAPPGDTSQATSGQLAGDTVKITATGTLRTNGRKAEGTGSFQHKRGATTFAVGSFTAQRLRRFTDFGTSAPFPSTFHGGKAVVLIKVTAHPGPTFTSTLTFDALLTIDCAINAPAGEHHEGVTLEIISGPFKGEKFDTEVAGMTVFVAQGEREEED